MARVSTKVMTVAFAMLLALPSVTTAQAYPRTEVSLAGGPANYDLSGVGWTQVYSARIRINPIRWIAIEPGLTYFDYRSQFSRDRWYLMPEVQLQFTPFEGRFGPYVGGGIGGARVAFADGQDWTWTLSGAGGLRLQVSQAWGILGELRVWAVDPFAGTVARFAVGISRRF